MQDKKFGEGTLAVQRNEYVIKPVGERVAPGILQFHHSRFPTQQGPVDIQHLPEGGREDHDVDILGARKGGRQDIHQGAWVWIRIKDDLFVTNGCRGFGGGLGG